MAGLEHFLEKEKGSSLESAAKLYLARVHADSNRFSEAKDLFQQVIEQDQTSQMLKTIARISLVSLLEQEQDWNGARGMLDVLTQERWSDLQWFTQARIARQEGKVEEAKKHWGYAKEESGLFFLLKRRDTMLSKNLLSIEHWLGDFSLQL